MYCLKKMPEIVDKSSIKKICIDDFAVRKRFSYGTVMVDLETHRIVDMIPSRDVADVSKWLDEYPGIEIVSRDGAQIYASAIRGTHPYAQQVSDRFHLIKGLSDAIEKFIIRTYPSKIEIPAVSTPNEEIRTLLNVNNRFQRIKFAQEQKQKGLTTQEIAFILRSSCKTIEKYLNVDLEREKEKVIRGELRHKRAVEQKQNEVEEARRMAKRGIPIEQIAKELHHTFKTIQNYLDPDYSLVNGHYNARIPGKLAPYESKVVELRSKGMTYSNIHKIISAEGYSGSVASLRMFIQKERIRSREEDNSGANSDYSPKEYVQRGSLLKLIYCKAENAYSISKEQYKKVMEVYPRLAELYSIAREFSDIIFSRNVDMLDSWLEKVANVNIPELNTYINGVQKDVDAVKNGISLAYNNGLAEGSVNKIKVIKRIMYGRNSFELLKSKVLLHEKYYCASN